MRFSLRTKILLLVAGTVAGLAALVVLALTVLAGQEMNRVVRADVRATGTVLAQFMRARGLSLKDQSRLLARQPALKAYFQHPDRATFKDFAEDFRQQIHADSALLTDRDGRVLGETGTETSYRANRANEPGVTSALEGAPWTGVVRRDGQMMLAVSVPITIGPEVWGTFTAFSALNTAVARDLQGILSGSEVAFVDKGRVVGASLPLPPYLSTPENTPRLMTLGDERYYALYAPLPDTQARDRMGFIVLRPYAAATAVYNRFREVLGLVSILILALALVAGALVARNITAPLENVVRAALVVREGSWPERFAVRRKDEIGLLESVFNDMTAGLRANQEQLLALIKHSTNLEITRDEMSAINAKLEAMASTDGLTGLKNHRTFQDILEREFIHSAREGTPLSLALLDVDKFKQYNDLYGHPAGDEVLKMVARLLEESSPATDIVARYGGEEFVVVMPNTDRSGALAKAERLRTRIEGAPRSRRPVTASFGIASLTPRTPDRTRLIAEADEALYASKKAGRNCVCHYAHAGEPMTRENDVSGDSEKVGLPGDPG